jgi:hypothetical protein
MVEPGARSKSKLPLGPTEERTRSPYGQGAAVVLVIVAIAAAIAPASMAVRAVVAAALLVAAFAVARLTGRRMLPPRGWITIDATGVTRAEDGVSARVVSWSEPFGLSVLANHDRSRLLLAFTTTAQARYLGVRIGDVDDRAAAGALLARASTVLGGDPIEGDPDATLSGADATRLLAAVAARAPASLERIFLSDAHGDPVVLDGGALRFGTRSLDLAMPLEWRAFVFHESGGRVATLYQATWVRQADVEIVLVAPMPPDAPSAREARELRRMHAPPEEPPARELRLAVDRLFMLPLREALERAPRISRAPSQPSLPHRTEPRA